MSSGFFCVLKQAPTSETARRERAMQRATHICDRPLREGVMWETMLFNLSAAMTIDVTDWKAESKGCRCYCLRGWRRLI